MPLYESLARNMRRSPALAKIFAEQHVRDRHGNCAGCADFTVIAYPCLLAKLARESLNWAGRRG